MRTWFDVWSLISAQIVILPPAKGLWHSKAKRTATAGELEWEIEHGELLHVAELEWATDVWRRDGQWPPISEEARFYIRLRCDAAACYVFGLFHPRSRESLIPVPTVPIRDIVHWFLRQWWDWHGAWRVAQSLTTRWEEADEETTPE